VVALPVNSTSLVVAGETSAITFVARSGQLRGDDYSGLIRNIAVRILKEG